MSWERRKNWDDHTVRGHTCERLVKFQKEGGGCKPTIGEFGDIGGCDDTNYFFIDYCPFCGEKLEEVNPDETFYGMDEARAAGYW